LSLKSDNEILYEKRSKWFLTKGEKDIGPIDTKISEAHTDRPGIFIKQTYFISNLFSFCGLRKYLLNPVIANEAILVVAGFSLRKRAQPKGCGYLKCGICDFEINLSVPYIDRWQGKYCGFQEIRKIQ